MLLLWALLGFVLVLLVAFGLALRVAVKWGREGVELRQYGTETTGRVVDKRQTRSRGTLSAWIRYEYTDQYRRLSPRGSAANPWQRSSLGPAWSELIDDFAVRVEKRNTRRSIRCDL